MAETEKMTLKEEREMLLESIKLESQLEERFREIVCRKVKTYLAARNLFHLKGDKICNVKVLQKSYEEYTDIRLYAYGIDMDREYRVYDNRDNFEDVHKFIANVETGGYTVGGGKIPEDEEKHDYLGRQILEEYCISF